jgi:hypothetical protein
MRARVCMFDERDRERGGGACMKSHSLEEDPSLALYSLTWLGL